MVLSQCWCFTQGCSATAAATDEQCDAFKTCYACKEVPGCTWCFEGGLKNSKPACLSTKNKVCSREVMDISKCPIDRVKDLELLSGGEPGGQKLKSDVRCASLGNCRECLRFTYQCKWCLDGEQLPQHTHR